VIITIGPSHYCVDRASCVVGGSLVFQELFELSFIGKAIYVSVEFFCVS